MITATQTYPALTFSEIPLGYVRSVSLVVRSQPRAVFVYLLDEENYRRWQAQQRFIHHGPGGVTEFFGPVQVPHPGPWWLVLENRWDSPLRVEFGHAAV